MAQGQLRVYAGTDSWLFSTQSSFRSSLQPLFTLELATTTTTKKSRKSLLVYQQPLSSD